MRFGYPNEPETPSRGSTCDGTLTCDSVLTALLNHQGEPLTPAELAMRLTGRRVVSPRHLKWVEWLLPRVLRDSPGLAGLVRAG